MDDEGERSKCRQFDGSDETETDYDVIICGTDLVQSILSSALSRAGMKVLHCDGAEWYGGLDAVLYGGTTLELFLEGCESSVECPDDGADGLDVANLVKLLPKERHGDLKLHGLLTQTTIDREAQENDRHETNQVDDFPPQGDVDGGKNLDENPPTPSSAAKQTCENQTRAQQKKTLDMNGFCFDISPGLIYASGDAVDCLIKSGVSDYLEFKSLKGLHLLIEEDVKKSRTKRRTDEPSMDQRSRDDSKLACYRVPCSKGDVFKSKLLSPVDKRRLMKFLQLITDYGAAQQIEELEAKGEERRNQDNSEHAKEQEDTDDVVKSVNERFLHQGRALSRPQNKAAPSSGDLDSLMSCIQDSTSFSEFLSKVAKLPERLAKVVMYALSLAPGNNTTSTQGSGSTYTTKDGVDDLVAHMTALGRFGDTAFLVPMYGSGELSQAFCRSGAVYGSTYMLRRSPLAVITDDSKVVKGIVLSGEEHIGDANEISTDDIKDKSISCKNVIVPSTMMPSSMAHERQARIYRRVCILRGSLIRDDSGDDEQRHAVVIPPHTTSVDNMSAIHGVVFDESSFVAPSGKGYTLVHLTTSKQEGDATPDDVFVSSLERAYQMLVLSQEQTEDNNKLIEEIRHISFSYATGGEPPNCLSGLNVCHREGQSLTIDYAFAQARKIFETICPNTDFLGLSKTVEEAILYRDKEDSDDEQDVLESAVDMLRSEEDETGARDSEVTENRDPTSIVGSTTIKKS